MGIVMREPTESEKDVLRIVHESTDGVVLMPVVYNGQDRFALVLLMNRDGKRYLRFLAVLPVDSDKITDAEGQLPQTMAEISSSISKNRLN